MAPQRPHSAVGRSRRRRRRSEDDDEPLYTVTLADMPFLPWFGLAVLLGGATVLAQLTLDMGFSTAAGTVSAVTPTLSSGSRAADPSVDLLAETEKAVALEEVGQWRKAWEVYATALTSVPNGAAGGPDRREAVRKAAPLARKLRMHAASIELTQELLDWELREGAPPLRVLLAFADVASSLWLSGDADAAVESLWHCSQMLKGKLDPDGRALIARMASHAHSCRNDTQSALMSARYAWRLCTGDFDDGAKLLLLLRRHLREQGEGAEADPKISELQQLEYAVTDALLRDGRAHPMQLPVEYEEGLSARPIHHIAEEWPHLLPLVAALVGAADGLRQEYSRLRAAGMLHPDQECLSPDPSEWRGFTVNGAWQRLKRGCSTDAPRGCALLRRLRAMEIAPVLRMGYSALAPGGWIRPHFGRNNTVLKMHLGLVVPTHPDGTACAEIRVGSEYARWRQDEVLMLDDSFEHEAWNRCGEERVVLQVIIRHPEAKDQRMLDTVVIDD